MIMYFYQTNEPLQEYVDLSFRSEIGYGLYCLMTPDLSMDIQRLV